MTLAHAVGTEPFGIPSSRPLPEDDFFTSVNYNYLTSTKLPPDKAEVNNFTALTDKAKASIKAILKDEGNRALTEAPNPETKKVIDYYELALDFKMRDRLGITPLQAQLKAIDKVKHQEDLKTLMTDGFLLGLAPWISVSVEQDYKKSHEHILYINRPEIGLEKNYLVGKDPFAKRIQAAYKTYIKTLLLIAGMPDAVATQQSEAVFALEKQIATSLLTDEARTDLARQYNVMDLETIDKLAPRLPIRAVLEKFDLTRAPKIVVLEPAALAKLNTLLGDPSMLPAIKSELIFLLLDHHREHLNKAILKAYAKYHAAFTGLEFVEPDDDLAYQVTNHDLGELVGKLYVQKHFSPQTKTRVIALVHDIKDAYQRRIDALSWLSPATKAKAKEKLNTLTIKMGYPDQWHDWSMLTIKPYSDGGNLVLAAQAIDTLYAYRQFAKLHQAPDTHEWEMDPQEVNAYYNPVNNEIVFPAAILQAPFFDPNASYEQNLGAIGSVIGHELSHAFDKTGAQFDEKGNMNNWWTPEDLAKFERKTQEAAALFSAIEVLPGYPINGAIATDEIMADLGGLTMVLDIAEQQKLDLKTVLESYAKTWRYVCTRESLLSSLTDEHPPGKYRVNHIVNQMDAFYQLYPVTPRSRMYVAPKKRLHVW